MLKLLTLLLLSVSLSAFSINEEWTASQVINSPELASAFAGLSDAATAEALDQLSGNQHTNDPFITFALNRQFVRRMYDPVRELVTTMPCCRCEDPCLVGLDAWVEGSYDRIITENDANSFGFNSSGYEVTLGLQKSLCDTALIGIAGSYAHDFVHYNLGGHGKLDTGLLGIYALYRPQHWYIMYDISGSYTNNKIHRPINVGPLNFAADSSAPTYHVVTYGEVGVDLPMCWVLFQPFFGIESQTYWRDRTIESGASVANLVVYERRHTLTTSRLGLHATSRPYCTFSVSLDAAWNCRLTHEDVLFWQTFQNFGDFFQDHGLHLNRNSFDGAITVTSAFEENFKAYLQGTTEIWNRATDYSVVLGVVANF